MRDQDYPALYRSTDESSIEAQKVYLRMTKCQYGSLIAASLTALFFSHGQIFLVGYVIFVLVSTFFIIYGLSKNPQEKWYKNRALAESIKTITWRYMMHAEPYNGESSIAIRNLSRNLEEILRANNGTSKSISISPSKGDQITSEMNRIRNLSLKERQTYYLKNRVNEQYEWYRKKVDINVKANSLWGKLCIIVHASAILLAIFRVFVFDSISILPVHTMLVASSAIIGWIQIKRFNEIASAYSIATHEIGMIKSRIHIVSSEDDFSELVNDIELAFSREHTQWEARRKT